MAPPHKPRTKLKILNQDRAERVKPTDKPQIIEDPLLSGFALRVQPPGRKSWVLRYKQPAGKRTTRTLGKLPLMTYGMALEKARAGWQCAQRMQSIPVLGADTASARRSE